MAQRPPAKEKTDLSQFYGALRGARLEIRSGAGVVTGRLLSVERKTRTTGSTTVQIDLATVVSDAGEVRSVELTPGISVRLAERDVTDEVGRYLSLLASERQQDLRRMTIATNGAGDRQLYVSYISEVPIWKTTYRIVLPSKAGEQPLLQGWAVVDNTVGEDWKDVELSLVAGAPQSFIQPLSQPYYARRPVVPLPESAQLTPQTHEGAMQGGAGTLSGEVTDPSGADVSGAEVKVYSAAGNLVASTTTDSGGEYEIAGLAPGSYRVEFHSPGFNPMVVQGVSISQGGEQTQDATLQVGSVSQSVVVSSQSVTSLPLAGRNFTQVLQLAPGVAAGLPSNAALDAARRGAQAAAQGAELGDLFEYKLKDRVTIHKNESALVPILQAHVAGEKVSLWNSTLGSPRPLRALWLTNSSPLTLDGGSFSVLESEAFAGEGLIDAVKPGERRLLSYAADLGVRVDMKTEDFPQRITRVHIAHGVMVHTSELRRDATYTVRNDDTAPRAVVIEHPVQAGWTIAAGAPKAEETTSSEYRFRLSVEPKSTATLGVRESRPIDATYQLSNLTDDQIAFFVRQRSINPEVEAAFRKIVEQKNRVAALNAEISRRANEVKRIDADQERLRENMKALKGSAEERALTQRYTQQLSDQETRLDTLQKESADLEAQREKAQQELNKMIDDLTLDATI